MTILGEVANHLNKAKLFTEFDTNAVFWQKKLDLKSRYKITIRNHFGGYLWLCRPFPSP